jgi:release factor glutamine methyltransferase
VQSDLFSKISGKFSIITANPPYLSERDMDDFVVKELRFEPENAFFGGKTGFETTEKILACVPEFLKPNGYFITELGFEGSQFLDKKWSGLELESIIKDYSGTDRTAVFRKV